MQESGPSVQFYGARGSYPVMRPGFERVGGNTASLCVTLANRRILLDGGLGLISLGRVVAESDHDHLIFLSHLHYDHVVGLPFFQPLFMPGHRVRVFVPESMVDALRVFWGPPYHPLRIEQLTATVEILPLASGAIDLAALLGLADTPAKPSMKTLFLGAHAHPVDGVMIYRVSFAGKDIVYATDIESCTARLHEQIAGFCAGADLLICDTQFYDAEYDKKNKGWGHNSLSMSTRLAKEAGVKRLVLFHHAPDRNDAEMCVLEAEAQKQFVASQAAYEGLLLQL